MWPWRGRKGAVTCIACGRSLPRADAREYDKFGDRWDRDGKSFEYLCKPCFRGLCHLSRDGLEETLSVAGAGTVSDEEFLADYAALVAGEPEEAERESSGRHD